MENHSQLSKPQSPPPRQGLWVALAGPEIHLLLPAERWDHRLRVRHHTWLSIVIFLLCLLFLLPFFRFTHL